IGASFKLRELFGSSQTNICTRGIDSRDGHSQVVIVDQRGAYQLLQFRVFENVKPFQIADRGLVDWRCTVGTAKGIRDLLARDSAGQQTNHDDSNCKSID